MPKACGQNLILRPEPGRDEREARQGEAADQKGDEGQRHLLAQSAHVEHVLRVQMPVRGVDAVFHAVDDRAGAEEEQRLEEGVGDQVKGGRHVRPDADGGDHVAQLRDRRVGQDALDVVLGDGDGGGEQRRERADAGHDRHRQRQRIALMPAGGQQREEAHRPGTRRPTPWWRRGSWPKPASGLPWRPAARRAAGTGPTCRPFRGTAASRSGRTSTTRGSPLDDWASVRRTSSLKRMAR